MTAEEVHVIASHITAMLPRRGIEFKGKYVPLVVVDITQSACKDYCWTVNEVPSKL
jgi:hypothetical protein